MCEVNVCVYESVYDYMQNRAGCAFNIMFILLAQLPMKPPTNPRDFIKSCHQSSQTGLQNIELTFRLI